MTYRPGMMFRPQREYFQRQDAYDDAMRQFDKDVAAHSEFTRRTVAEVLREDVATAAQSA